MDQGSFDPSDPVDVQNEATLSKRLNPLLCNQCQAWDEVWSFPPLRGEPLSLKKLSDNTNCLICRAVTRVVDTTRGESESWHNWPASRIFVRNGGPFFLDTGSYVPHSPHRIDSSDPTRTIARLLISLEVSFLSDDPASPDDIHEATSSFAITPQFCLGYTTSDLPAGFRAIDVRSMNVVKPKHPLSFVALSYMWQQDPDGNHVQLENGNVMQLELPGGILDIPLPGIISDAISLCRDLQESYLWIDQLCIIQDDTESKEEQIRGMDKIYRSASLCIIAALNDRDGGGIPGCSGRPRELSIRAPNRHCEIEGRGIRPNGMDIIDYALWNRRGWTFQERVLSRRRLFITEFQVIFECSQGHASEELTYYSQRPYEPYDSGNSEQEKHMEEQEYHQMPAFTRRSTLGFHINHGRINYAMKADTSLVDYCDWVEDYTTRQLSRSSDILNAFAGVGNYLTESLGSNLIFGIPEKFLSQALMWSCVGLADRRLEMPGIPSWSWASSLKPAGYYWTTDSFSKERILKIASLVYFYFQDPDVGLRRLNVGERWVDHEIYIKELEDQEGVPELKGAKKYAPGAWRSNKTWQESPHGPWQTLAHQNLDPAACNVATTMPGSLIFNTTVASLKLANESSWAEKNKEATARDVAIHNQEGVLVGWLHNMSLEWIEAHQDNEQTYDFMVICGALAPYNYRKTVGFWEKDFDTWRLHVMLIERSPTEPCVARRLNVGWMFAHKWKDCNPRWETIVLR